MYGAPVVRALSFAALSLALALPSLARADALTDALDARCVRDGRLDAAALAALDDPQGFEASELRAVAWRAGLASPSVHALVLRGGDADSTAVALSTWLDARGLTTSLSRCAFARRGDLLAVAVTPRVLEVVTPTQGVPTWRVRVVEGLREASVVATSDGAEVRRAPIGAEGDASLALDPQVRWTVQVIATTPTGPLPFATWHFGGPSQHDGAEPDPLWSTRHVFAALNDLRREAHAVTLRRDPVLDDIAARHAANLARRGVLSHAPTADDTPLERLRAAGVITTRVAENLARGRTLTEANANLLRSPSHRANALDADVDAVGLGVARMAGVIYLVEVFAARPSLGARSE